MSEKTQNPLTENIGGGDDSQNRFKETFVVVRQFVNHDNDDSFTYLTFETFLASIPEHKRFNVEDQIMYGLTVSLDFIEDKESQGYLPGSTHFRKVKAIKFHGEYFVLQNVL